LQARRMSGKSLGDIVSKIISSYPPFEDEDPDNLFLITSAQISRLRGFLTNKGVTQIEKLIPIGETWESVFGTSRVLFKSHSQCQEIMTDQKQRCHEIIRHIKKHGNQQIILMDGHGRFVSMLSHGLGVNEQSVRIHVVDIDQNAVEWHNLFFPKNITGEKKDIFDVVDEQSVSGDDGETKPFIYLNFCGIADALRNRGIESIADLEAFVKKLSNLQHVMISFSVRGNHNCINTQLETLLNASTDFIPISKRGNFVTWICEIKKRKIVDKNTESIGLSIPKKKRL